MILSTPHPPPTTAAKSCVHNLLKPETGVWVSTHGNNFRLAQGTRPCLLIAGGIGITPMLPMIETLQARNVPWRLFHLGSHPQSMAYAQTLGEHYLEQVEIWSSAR